MSLFDHLSELRSRLFKCAVAITIGFAVGFVVREQILFLLREPYCDLPAAIRSGANSLAPDQACPLIVLRVMDGFFISMKAASIVAVLVGGPVTAYQIWRFVTPGLRPVERRYAIPFLLASFVLFTAGAVFSFYLLPQALALLLSFAGEGIAPVLGANEYLSFIIFTMLSFGVAFEFPLILLMLILAGVVGPNGLITYRRHAIFGIFVAAAVITPTGDPITMSAMAVPLYLFYEICVVVAKVVERRRRRRAAVA